MNSNILNLSSANKSYILKADTQVNFTVSNTGSLNSFASNAPKDTFVSKLSKNKTKIAFVAASLLAVSAAAFLGVRSHKSFEKFKTSLENLNLSELKSVEAPNKKMQKFLNDLIELKTQAFEKFKAEYGDKSLLDLQAYKTASIDEQKFLDDLIKNREEDIKKIHDAAVYRWSEETCADFFHGQYEHLLNIVAYSDAMKNKTKMDECTTEIFFLDSIARMKLRVNDCIKKNIMNFENGKLSLNLNSHYEKMPDVTYDSLAREDKIGLDEFKKTIFNYRKRENPSFLGIFDGVKDVYAKIIDANPRQTVLNGEKTIIYDNLDDKDIEKLGDEIKKGFLKGNAYVLYNDDAIVKENPDLQIPFEKGRFLSIKKPAIFVHDKWDNGALTLLGDECVGISV